MNAKLARNIWETIKANLNDRSVLHLGDADEETLQELEDEQVDAILHGFTLGSP